MNELVIIVSSCDKARNCWTPFVDAFNKAWPDCPCPRFFITNYLDIEDKTGGFEAIKVGEDMGWAANMKKALGSLSKECNYILYMQEDFWLTSTVHTAFIDSQLSFCRGNKLDYLRLTCPWMDSYRIDGQHAYSPCGKEQYALCLSAAIWKKDFFEQLLIPGWTGWDFEAKVEKLVSRAVHSLVLLEDVSWQEFRLIGLAGGAVRRGRWTRETTRYLKRNGFAPLVREREVEGLFYTGLLAFARLGRYPCILVTPLIVYMHRHRLNI